MAQDNAYRKAKQKIEAARRSGAKKLDLSVLLNDIDTPRLTKLPESLGQLTQLQSLDLGGNLLTALPLSLGELTQLQSLDLSSNGLTTLPDRLGKLTQLQTLDLANNQLTALPESLGQLLGLQSLDLSGNRLKALPESLGQLTHLRSLSLSGNRLKALPESLGQLTQLQTLDLANNQLTALPESLGQLTQLREMFLFGNRLAGLPACFCFLKRLVRIDLGNNQIEKIPNQIGELIALQNLDLAQNRLADLPEAMRRLANLRVLSLSSNRFRFFPECLCGLANLTELYFIENEISELPRDICKLVHLDKLLLGGCELSDTWRYGGGTHGNKLISLPNCLVDLEKLRELNLDGNPLNPELAAAYKEGLDSVKRYLRAKAEAEVVLNEAKLILVGEGGVGKTSLLAALKGEPFVEERPTTHGVEVDITAFQLTDPESGTEITFNGWDFGGQNIYRHTHQLFFTAPAVYLAVWDPRRGPDQCCVDEWIKMIKHRAYEETEPEQRPRILVVATRGGPKERLAHIDEQKLRDQFGDLIVGFYHIDSRPDDQTGQRFGIDNLKEAIVRTAGGIQRVGRSVPASWKRVLDAVRERSRKDAYISYAQFESICDDQEVSRELAGLYAAVLNELGHLIHYRAVDDLKDTVILKPEWLSKAISFVLEDEQAKQQNGLVEHDRLTQLWDDPARGEDRYPEEIHPVFLKLMERFDLSYRVVMPDAGAPDTSLIAQLVPGGRPEGWAENWGSEPEPGDAERTQVCRIVDAETGRTAEVEGLLYRLIVRLHRYSLGRENYYDSRHWKTGMILDDAFNGRAFIEEIAGDIRVTVRAAYPERFLHHLCEEVRWLVDHFWKGLECQLSVPCHPPCKGLFEVEQLIETKRENIDKIRCSVCKKFYEIDSLLATVAPKPTFSEALAELKQGQAEIQQGMKAGFGAVRADLRRLVSQADEQFAAVMTALTDPAKDGPRLFSFEAVEPGFWDKPKWIAEKFRVTLWCEHSRVPLPLLTGDKKRGVYELELTRDWVKRAAPVLKVLSSTLSLALPIAGSAMKLAADEAAYKSFEKQLDFGQKCADSFLKGGKEIGGWLARGDDADLQRGEGIRAQGSVLRELHGLLRDLDPHNGFGGLERVQNKRREFLWVHPQYVDQY